MSEEKKLRKEEIEREILAIQDKLNYQELSDDEKRVILEELERLSNEHNELFMEPVNERDIPDGFLNVEASNLSLNELNSRLETIKNSANPVGVKEINSRINELSELLSDTNKLLEGINDSIVRDEDVDATMELTTSVNNLIREIKGLMEKSANERVTKYVSDIERIERHMNLIISKMNNDLSVLHDVSGEVSELVSEYEGVRKEFNEIVELLNSEISDPYVVSPNELNDRLKKIRADIRLIKNKQINNYNRMVTILNNRLDTLAGRLGDVPEELRTQLASMLSVERLETYNYEVTKYNVRDYLNYLNYEKLKEQLLLTVEIEKAIDNAHVAGRSPESNLTDDDNYSREDDLSIDPVEALDVELKSIEDKMVELHESYKDDMTDEELNKFYEEINNVENLLDIVKLNLVDADDHIKNDDKLLERVRKGEETLDNLKHRHNQLFATRIDGNDLKGNVYTACMTSLTMLHDKIENTVNMLIDPAFEDKNVSKNAINVFMNNLDKLEQEVKHFEQMVEANKDSFNDEQYKNLTDGIVGLNEFIKNGRDNVNSFIVLKESGFFDLLTDDLDGLDEALNKFEDAIDVASVDKDGNDIKIKKEERKVLDNMHKNIVQMINRIETNLEKYKETDSDKYNEEVEKLNDYKAKLEKLEKKYHSKCGFFVRTVRSAKKFYKKHKKAILIAAGLVSIALLAKPVIIPALMHGIELIAPYCPGISSVSNFLGKLIGASITETSVNGVVVNAWRFASGLMLTPIHTSTSLLKGIAMVAGNTALLGVGGAGLIGSAVMSLKALTNKMKKKDGNKVVNVIRDTVDNTKKKVSDVVQNVGKKVSNMAQTVGEKKDSLIQKGKNLVENTKERNSKAKVDKIVEKIDSLSPEMKAKLIERLNADEGRIVETGEINLDDIVLPEENVEGTHRR